MATHKNIKFPRVGRVYRIWNDIDDQEYVGCTFQELSQRMRDHRSHIFAKGCKGVKLYQLMREYGVEHFKIEIIKEYEINSKNELHQHEGKYIRKYRPSLNTVVSCRTQQQYYLDNIDKIKVYRKQWTQNNKENQLIKQKQRYNKNKAELSRKWREPFYCKCGITCTETNKLRHWKSNFHQLYETFGGLNYIDVDYLLS